MSKTTRRQSASELKHVRLLASAPGRRTGAAAGAGTISLVLHGLLVGLLGWGMARASSEVVAEEEVTIVELVDEVAPPPEPPPQQQDAPAPPEAPPQGFQTLVVPDVVRPEIPPPSFAFSGLTARDFTGEGIEGGREMRDTTEANKTEREILEEAPAFTPFTVAPTLKNRDEVARTLEREYPPMLRDAGIGGSVNVWLFIDEQGAVQDVRVNKSSGFEALDDAALRVGSQMEFTPALNRDERVVVWVSIPITFQVR